MATPRTNRPTFDPDLTSTRRTRSASPGRSSVHGA